MRWSRSGGHKTAPETGGHPGRVSERNGGGAATSEIVCAKTKRPALLAGEAVQFTVEHVQPAKKIKWTNPDGDGAYRLTVKNASDAEIEVPALLARDGEPLWSESVAILCQGKVYPVPGATGDTKGTGFVKLEPGASVSGVVNALALVGPKWPRGGYRIEFLFCLGEKSQTKSFYYLSKHHDKVREALENPKKPGNK